MFERPARAGPHAGIPHRTAPARLRRERLAVLGVRASGIVVIGSLAGIVLFLLAETLPLVLGGPELEVEARIDSDLQADAVARLTDPYRSVLVELGRDGSVRARDLRTGESRGDWTPFPRGPDGAPPALSSPRAFPEASLLAAVLPGGEIATLPVAFPLQYDGGARRVEVSLGPVRTWSLGAGEGRVTSFAVARDARSWRVVASRTRGAAEAQGSEAGEGELRGVEVVVTKPLVGEPRERTRYRERPSPGAVRELQIGHAGRRVYAIGPAGELLEWSLDSARRQPPRAIRPDSPIRALSLLEGGRTLLTGHDDGSIGVWFEVPRGQGRSLLVRVRRFVGGGSAPLQQLAPAGRSALALRTDGSVELFHATTGHLATLRGPGEPRPGDVQVSPRGDGFLLASSQGVESLALRNPHPEVTLSTLFLGVWYEGYPGPALVWQSTGGSDRFEPKLSLTPLLAGTLKGTLYALLFALPLGLLGALYASHFMPVRLLRWIKPAIELTASLPSVVLGFLAGLWLAPRLEAHLAGLLLLPVALPCASLAAGWLWSGLPRALRRRAPAGAEILWQAAALSAVLGACLALDGRVEALLFGGDVSAWLRDTTGLVYEQRNALVAGLAMGFAVVPVLFTIAEDALSNVPRELVSGSLALGATRWQTVRRVVLPVAAPGLLAAVLIALGRAIGETMIVLMAAGNTPLLDLDAFSGFRALSANIAVEIPEAPNGSTLYRTLFASSLLLFALTFALNTGAEWARQHLRRRQGIR